MAIPILFLTLTRAVTVVASRAETLGWQFTPNTDFTQRHVDFYTFYRFSGFNSKLILLLITYSNFPVISELSKLVKFDKIRRVYETRSLEKLLAVQIKIKIIRLAENS